MKALSKNIKDFFAHQRANAVLFLSFGAAFFFSAVYFFANKNVASAMISLLYLVILSLMPWAARLSHLDAPAATYAFLLILCLGSLLGSCYNFYLIIPYWDILLHILSGWIFACIGYAICILLFSKHGENKVFACLFFGVLFSLAIALLWELFEASATALLSVDMQEDTLVHEIKSFYLSGTHDYPMLLSNIKKTVIHYGSGETLTLAGYLDLGLADTLEDMAVCLLGNFLFLLLFPLDKLLGGRLLPLLLPKILYDEKVLAHLGESEND